MESLFAAKAASTAKAAFTVKAASAKSAGLNGGIESKTASKVASKIVPEVNSYGVSKAGASKAITSDGFSQSVHSLGNVSVTKVTCQQCNHPGTHATTNTVSSKFGQDVHTVNPGVNTSSCNAKCAGYCSRN